MRYRVSENEWRDTEADVRNKNFMHEHPLLKKEDKSQIKTYCPICDVVFGIILKVEPNDRKD